jgi:hypothetical protein
MALSIGTVSVLDKAGEVFKRIWCALAVLRPHSPFIHPLRTRLDAPRPNYVASPDGRSPAMIRAAQVLL